MNNSAAAAAGDGGAATARRNRLILLTVVFAQLLVWLDNTILAIALQVLSEPDRGLGASPGELQWAVSSYTLVFAALLFTGGVLGDRFGHRRVLLAGLVVFGLSSVLAAYAPGAGILITARALMGVGSALLMPATLSAINWTFSDPKARAGAIGLWSASSGVAVAVGPLVGGALLARFWWGSIFLINLPIVVISIIGVLRYVPEFRNERVRRLDPVGLLLSVLGLVGLVYGVIQAGNVDEWARPDVLGPIGLGAAAIVAFVLVELRIANAGFDVRLLREPRFLGASLAVMFTFFGVTGQLFYSNFYLQGTRGYSPLLTGLLFLPNAVLLVVTAPNSGRLVRRFSVRAVSGTGLAVTALTFAAYRLFGLTTPIAWYEVLMAAQGFGIGLVIAPLTGAATATVPNARIGAGAAVITAMRQVGGVFGVAVLGTVLTVAYRTGIGPALASLPADRRAAAAASPADTRQVAGLAGRPDLLPAVDQAYLHAMYVTSAFAAVVTALGVLAVVVSFRRRAAPSTGAASTGAESPGAASTGAESPGAPSPGAVPTGAAPAATVARQSSPAADH
jgi:EmrB/QacA subfamily drug resistance transporter